LLLTRAWRQQVRDHALHIFRLLLSCGLASALGEVFGNGKPSHEDRASVLLFSAINTAMSAMIKTIDRIGSERPVVWRERSRSLYGSVEYILAKLLAELPVDAGFAAGFAIVLRSRHTVSAPMQVLAGLFALEAAAASTLGLALGAAAPDPQAALALGTAVALVQMLPAVSMRPGTEQKPLPLVIEAVAQTSSVKWAAESLLQAEFKNEPHVLKRLDAHNGAQRLFGLIALEALAAVGALQLQSVSNAFLQLGQRGPRVNSKYRRHRIGQSHGPSIFYHGHRWTWAALVVFVVRLFRSARHCTTMRRPPRATT